MQLNEFLSNFFPHSMWRLLGNSTFKRDSCLLFFFFNLGFSLLPSLFTSAASVSPPKNTSSQKTVRFRGISGSARPGGGQPLEMLFFSKWSTMLRIPSYVTDFLVLLLVAVQVACTFAGCLMCKPARRVGDWCFLFFF